MMTESGVRYTKPTKYKRKTGHQCRKCGRPARNKQYFTIPGGFRFETWRCDTHVIE